jgi:hypothetical protein
MPDWAQKDNGWTPAADSEPAVQACQWEFQPYSKKRTSPDSARGPVCPARWLCPCGWQPPA